jgi:hypothetical protein
MTAKIVTGREVKTGLSARVIGAILRRGGPAPQAESSALKQKAAPQSRSGFQEFPEPKASAPARNS